MHNRFVALDFETANYSKDSACAVGLVLVENRKIIDSASFLIKPPSQQFVFTYINGITWDDVKNEPCFDEVWLKIEKYFHNIDYVAAHFASFDESVLESCCERYGILLPKLSFKCTLQLSRSRLVLDHYRLCDVSTHYGIELDHHNALSDATACAKIMINLTEPVIAGS